MRYIDADALQKRFETFKSNVLNKDGKIDEYDGFQKCMYLTVCACLEEVVTAPTADVAPVVRCKDCKHWNAQASCVDGCGVCDILCFVTREDFYCAYGKRQTNVAPMNGGEDDG